MKAIVLTLTVLCSFTATAADDDKDCQKEIANVAERTKIRDRAARLIGSDEGRTAAAKAFIADASMLWTCSKDAPSHCCNKIPVDVFVDASACFVTLPYGKLDVSTSNGTNKQKVVWELRVEKSADILFKYKFAFDKVAGIKLFKIPSVPLPVQNGDHEGASDNKFRLESTGVVNTKAGHLPRVYPKKDNGSLDLANECTPWDPTITNTN